MMNAKNKLVAGGIVAGAGALITGLVTSLIMVKKNKEKAACGQNDIGTGINDENEEVIENVEFKEQPKNEEK